MSVYLNKIIAIDPGSRKHGYVTITPGRKPVIRDAGHVDTTQILHIIEQEKPDKLLIEDFEKTSQTRRVNSQDVIDTCKQIGFIQGACSMKGVAYEEVSRKKVVLNLCGKNRSGKRRTRTQNNAEVKYYLEHARIFPPDELKKVKGHGGHAWQALGMFYYWWSRNMNGSRR